jgi:hypothetical protein
MENVMPEFVLTLLGIVGGALVIAGALYLAVRPELRPKRRKSWLARPSGEPHGPGGFSPGDFGGPDHSGPTGP